MRGWKSRFSEFLEVIICNQSLGKVPIQLVGWSHSGVKFLEWPEQKTQKFLELSGSGRDHGCRHFLGQKRDKLQRRSRRTEKPTNKENVLGCELSHSQIVSNRFLRKKSRKLLEFRSRARSPNF